MARPGAIMALRRAITTIMPRRDVTHQRGATMGPLPGATRRVTPQDITTARRPITTTGGRVFQGAPLTNKSGAPCFFEARYENMPATAATLPTNPPDTDFLPNPASHIPFRDPVNPGLSRRSADVCQLGKLGLCK